MPRLGTPSDFGPVKAVQRFPFEWAMIASLKALRARIMRLVSELMNQVMRIDEILWKLFGIPR